MLALFRWLRTVWLSALFMSSGFRQVHVARAGEAVASPYLSSEASPIAAGALRNTLSGFCL